MRLLLFIIVLFIGCGEKKYIYWNVHPKSQNTSKSKKVAFYLTYPDYMKTGYVAALKNGKLIYLNIEIPGSIEEFYSNYLKEKFKTKGIDVKIYPWEFNFVPKKIYKLKILEYLISLDKKEVILFARFDNKNFLIKKKFKKEFLKTYRDVFDELITKIGGLI